MEKVKVELPTNMTESEKSCEKERKNKEAIEGYLEKFNNSLPSKYQFLEDRYGDLKLAEGLVKKNVFLHGETGSGKTVLGILILYEIIKIRKQVKFISCSDFIYGLQGDYQASEDKVRSVMDFRGCLMLDDLGAEKLTDFVRQTYYLIINHREALLRALERKTRRLLYLWSRKHNNVGQVCSEMLRQDRDDVHSGDDSIEHHVLIQLNKTMARHHADIISTYRMLYLLGMEGSALPGRTPAKKHYTRRISIAKAQLDRVMYAATVCYDHEKTKLEYANVHDDAGFNQNKYVEAVTYSFNHKHVRAILPRLQTSKLTKNQKILYTMMPRFMANNFRYRAKYKGGNKKDIENIYLYRERKTKYGKSTYTWERYMTIQNFISNEAQPSRGGDGAFMDLITSAPGNTAARSIIEFLTSGNFHALPELVKDRYVFAFQNGIYYVRENHFHAFNDGPVMPAPVACNYIDETFDINWVGHARNNPKMIVSKTRRNIHTKEPMVTFEVPRTMRYGTWRDIETPLIESILQYQGIVNKGTMNVLDWFYVMCGRMFYNVGETDNWQVVLFLLGNGGTGKSTIMQYIMSVYDTDDTNNIANRVEGQFGLSAYKESLMNVALDINKQFQLDPCDFKSIAAVEPVQMAEKFKTSSKRLLKGSWAFVANEFPGWDEKGGSIERRLALFLFNIPVQNDSKDTGLLDRMREQEMGKFIVKANRAYREMVSIVGERSVHLVWPKKYFSFNTDTLRAMINPLARFLCDAEEVYRDPNLDTDGYSVTQSPFYCTVNAVKDAYRAYCHKKKLKFETWTPLFYGSTINFYRYAEKKATSRHMYPRHALRGGEEQPKKLSAGKKLFFGLDLVKNLSNTERHQASLDD